MELDKIFLEEIAKINKSIEESNSRLSGYTVLNNLQENEMLNLSNELRIIVKEKLKKKLLVEFISNYSNENNNLNNNVLDNQIIQFETLYGNVPFNEDEDEDKDMILVFGQNFILDYVLRKPVDEQKQIYFGAILESLKRQGFTREQINEELIKLGSQLYNIENVTTKTI